MSRRNRRLGERKAAQFPNVEAAFPTVEQEMQLVLQGEALLDRAHTVAHHIDEKVREVMSLPSCERPDRHKTRTEPSDGSTS